MKMERRTAELRMAQTENDDLLVDGYAMMFDTPTVIFEYDGIKYSEVIQRGALDGADMSDVPFKYNHSSDVMVMARTRNKTLALVIDESGLKISANLAKTSGGKDLYELIRRGDIDKMSFAFTVEKDSYNEKTRTRTIEKIKKLYDVAAVGLPAYEQTSISARSWADEQLKKDMEAIVEIERRRKILILKTYF